MEKIEIGDYVRLSIVYLEDTKEALVLEIDSNEYKSYRKMIWEVLDIVKESGISFYKIVPIELKFIYELQPTIEAVFLPISCLERIGNPKTNPMIKILFE